MPITEMSAVSGWAAARVVGVLVGLCTGGMVVMGVVGIVVVFTGTGVAITVELCSSGFRVYVVPPLDDPCDILVSFLRYTDSVW